MNINLIKALLLLLCISSIFSGCSVAKIEARLEANPQCKDVVNPKTGALMPCPGSDKTFYREAGLAPAKAAPTVNSPPISAPNASGTSAAAQASSGSPISSPLAGSSTQTPAVAVECKPQIHKKTGGTLPCPAPD